MNHISNFENFTRINEATTTVKGIPVELFNAIKGAQIGIKVAGKNLSRKPDKNIARLSDEEVANMPSMREAITPYLTSIGWMNNPNIEVKFHDDSDYYRGWVEISVGKYVKMEFSLSYYDPYAYSFEVELWNAVRYTRIKKAEFYGDLNDQIQAVKNIIDANMDVWNAAMSEAPQSTADAYLDTPHYRRAVERFLKDRNDLRDLSRGIVGVSLFDREPGADRKKGLQDVIKFIQTYLNDKDFINADVKHRRNSSNNILNKDGKWE